MGCFDHVHGMAIMPLTWDRYYIAMPLSHDELLPETIKGIAIAVE